MEKSRVEWILRYGLGEVSTLPPRLSRIEKLLVELIRKGSEGDITVDDELSPTSENPVQNKVLNSIINGTGSGSVYSKIMLAIAEVVAEAPEDFDTLKEISDWISHHEDSAAAMNSAIQANTTAIDGKVDKVSGKGLSTNDYTTEEKTKLSGIANDATDIGRLYPNSSNGEIFNNYISNKASGNYSHAEGNNTTASGNYSHAEGNYCAASGGYSHAEGSNCKALGNYSHASGNYTIAKTTAQTVIGKYNVSDDNNAYAFVIGNGSADNTRSNAFAVGWNGLIYQNNSETGVDLNNKVDKVSGKGLSTNDYTTEEKNKLASISVNASDVGQLYPNSTHGEIFNNYQNSARPNVASGDYSHAEGGNNTASGAYSHAEGAGNTVSGNYSHAEGGNNTASGAYSHAEGYGTLASGSYSHAEGTNTIAASDEQHVQGKCNVEDANGKFAFIIGNGTHWDRRSNAFAIDWNGLIYQNNSETGIDLFSLSSTVDNKVDKVVGKGLSTNDYTTAEKTKLSGIEEGATKTIIDANLSSTSTNPVQNKAVKAALDSKADTTVINAVGLRLVASDVLTSNTTYTYQMSKNDFDKSELGTYIISIVTWSTTPKYSLYAVSYTGNTIFRNLVTKIAGDDMTVTVEDAVISASGFPSNGGKISIHALQ